MKTKKLISVVLALTMICSMFMSAVPVMAADESQVSYEILVNDVVLTDETTVKVGDKITYNITVADAEYTEDAGADVYVTTSGDYLDGFGEHSGAETYDEETGAYAYSLRGEGFTFVFYGNVAAEHIEDGVVQVDFSVKVEDAAGTANVSIPTSIAAAEATEPTIIAPVITANPGTNTLLQVGDEVTYTITATNYTEEAADIVIASVLDENVEYVSDGNSGMEENGTVTWNELRNVQAGATKSVTLTVKVLEGAREDKGGNGFISASATAQIGENEAVASNTVTHQVATPHVHPVCGENCDGDCGVEAGEHAAVEWTALTQDMVDGWIAQITEGDSSFTLPAGNYYLANNITASLTAVVTDDCNLCLNGYMWEASTNAFKLTTANKTMSVCDCGNTGTVSADRAAVVVGEYNKSSNLSVYGGTMHSKNYIAVNVNGSNSNVNIYEGTVISDTDEALSVNSGHAYIRGGSFVGGENYSAVRFNTDSANGYIQGEINIRGSIADINFVARNTPPVKIIGEITVDEPITVMLADGIGDFTSGWNTYMSSAKPTDYFASTDSSKVVALNATTNELYLADKTVIVNAENGTVEADNWVAVEGDEVTLTVTPDEGYKLGTLTVKNDSTAESVACNATAVNGMYTFTMPTTSSVTVTATFTEIPYSINISDSFANGTVTADVTEATVGTTVNLTVTPDEFYKLETLTVVDDSTGGTILSAPLAEGIALLAAEETYSFTMPASTVTVNATFALDTAFTVSAVVNTATTDKDTAEADMDVYSGDKVYIDVVVNGADYTNADWTLVYDSSKFKYVETQQNADYGTLGYYTLDDSNADGNVLAGSISGVAGKTEDLDEFTDGEAVVTYVFEAIPQAKEVTGKFAITEAHANTYAMAGDQNNTPALTENVDVTILLVDEDAATQIPTGSIENATVTYNALEQAGNEYVLDAQFEGATVTYYATEDGSAVADSNGDGVIDAAELDGLTFRTGLPTWKNVGTYTYYVKVSGSGLATIYASATLTIEPLKVTPTVTFAVDPDVSKVTITPVIEGVLDDTYTGTVKVTVNGTEYTFTADKFKYDGESSAVCTESFDVVAPTSGTLTANATYTAGIADNYADGTGSATVDVDKLTFDNVTALEDTITSVFPYDSTAHGVVIGDLTAITEGTWIASTPVDAYDGTENPTVTNVGDERLVKVVFTDSTGVYSDVVVYVILKVTPAEVVITVGPEMDPVGTYSKAVGENDPDFEYGITVELADGSTQTTLFGGDDLGVELEREPGEAAGTYTITATYVPNANYNVTVIDGKLEIGAPEIGVDGDVKIEVVDLSKGLTNGDVQPDYIADKRLILVYTDLNKAYYGYGTADNYEKFFDVTAAGYKYVDNNYTDGTYTEDATEYKHVYGIVVDKIDTYEATEAYEQQYLDKVIFLGSDVADAPESIVYDADINLTEELDINDYSMNNGIYNTAYDRATYIRSILKADYNHDKVVNTDDSLAVKGIVDVAVTVTP